MFTPTQLLAFFQCYPAPTYWLAYSGGLDSHVLLHACAQLRLQQPQLNFKAIHVDHGLQAMSTTWAMHCQSICQQLAIPLSIETLNLTIPAGESLEAIAREARYAAFSHYLQASDILLTAHHQDDQAETLLLHLMRGSGVDGLAAMPSIRPLGLGRLARPLLALSRTELSAYANAYALAYIQDPSNAQLDFNRNYLRHTVLPLLQQRWPSTGKTLARAAHLQGETRALLAELVAEKLPQVQGGQANTLAISKLLTQSTALQKALLRVWLTQQGFDLPQGKHMQQILTLLSARTDATPYVTWRGCEVRRYRDQLYAMAPLWKHDSKQVFLWDINQPLLLPTLNLQLDPAILGKWLTLLHSTAQTVSVRFRRDGEVMWIPYRGGHRSVKHLMQEAGIPPWQRERLPLIYVQERLIMIYGVIRVEPE